MRLAWLALLILALGLGTLSAPFVARPKADGNLSFGLSAGGGRPSTVADIFPVTLSASDQAGKPLVNACFHWTFVQTGPSGQQDYDLCTNDSGATSVNYGTGFASSTLTISQSSAPPGCSGGLTSPQTYDLTSGGAREIDVQFTCTPPPAVGKTVDAKAVSGAITVRLPGTTRFVPLEQLRQVPVGSEIDATKGTVSIESATGVGKTTKTLIAYAGRFVVTQARKKLAVTKLRLSGGDFAVCARTLAALGARRSRHVVRRLWGKGKGRFATRGRYSSSTVRGTFWLTEDRCDGTRTTVRQGVVAVKDFPGRRTVLVHAGQSYLARAT